MLKQFYRRIIRLVKVERKPRGIINCPLGHKLHSDVNGALNIMRLEVKKIVNVLGKPLSFLVLSSGVTPLKGSNALDPSGTLAGRRGGQHCCTRTIF
jgi:putative transposase